MPAGLCLFGMAFAVNSSLHSYLVLAYAGSAKAAEDVGFYYAANAAGRFAGTLLSGLLYGHGGLAACLWASAAMLAGCWMFTLALPVRRAQHSVNLNRRGTGDAGRAQRKRRQRQVCRPTYPTAFGWDGDCAAATGVRATARPSAPRSERAPGLLRDFKPAMPAALWRCIQSRRVCCWMPLCSAAAVRDRPSRTNASAKSRRTRAASWHVPVTVRRSNAVKSTRVSELRRVGNPAGEPTSARMGIRPRSAIPPCHRLSADAPPRLARRAAWRRSWAPASGQRR